MAGEVNAVDSVNVNVATQTSQPARVVEQDEEQLFEFSGDAVLETAYKVIKTASEYTLVGAVKKAIDGEGVLPENTKDLVPDKVKEFIHEKAEEIRDAKKDKSFIGGFWLTAGLAGTAITWLDEQINK